MSDERNASASSKTATVSSFGFEQRLPDTPSKCRRCGRTSAESGRTQILNGTVAGWACHPECPPSDPSRLTIVPLDSEGNCAACGKPFTAHRAHTGFAWGAYWLALVIGALLAAYCGWYVA